MSDSTPAPASDCTWFEEQLREQRDAAVQRWTDTSWFLALRYAPIESRIDGLPSANGTGSGDYLSMQAALRLLGPVIERVKDDLAGAEARVATDRFARRALEEADGRADFEDVLDDYARSVRRTERTLLESLLELLDSIERLQERWMSVVAELGAPGDGPTATSDLQIHWSETSHALRGLRGRTLLCAPGMLWRFRADVVADRRVHGARVGLAQLYTDLLDHLAAVHGVTRLTDDRLIGAYPPFETTRIERREDTGTGDAIVVTRILEHGYLWHDNLLRKTAVTVRTQQGVST